MSTALASPVLPDTAGHFGQYGGVFVPETLIFALEQLEAEYRKAQADPAFRNELASYLHEFVGRPTPTRRRQIPTKPTRRR